MSDYFTDTAADTAVPAAVLDRDNKVLSVFGNLIIDKRRLPMSQLSKRGIPAYVAEWVLDSIVPGQGPLTEPEAAKVQAWTNKYIPSSGDKELIEYRLGDGEILKVLTSVQVEIELYCQRS
jgi:ATP-dependent Lon protease